MRDRTAVLLRVRRALERRAQAQVARAEAELHEAVEAARQRARDHDQRATGTGGRGLTPLQLRALQVQGMASWAAMADASATADRAGEQLADRRDDHRRTVMERRITERMADRRQQAAAVAAAATAQRMLDDLTVSRWGRD
jgi:hypothetical protein